MVPFCWENKDGSLGGVHFRAVMAVGNMTVWRGITVVFGAKNVWLNGL